MTNVHPLLSPEWYTGGILYLDFSARNKALSKLDPTDPKALGAYTEQLRQDAGAKLSVGKYGEDRTIYQQAGFQKSDKACQLERDPRIREDDNSEPRTVHLGLDLNLPAGTELYLPMDGTVVGLANNTGAGNYGPTVIIEHDLNHLDVSPLSFPRMREPSSDIDMPCHEACIPAAAKFFSLYGHLSSEILSTLQKGQRLKAGDVFAHVGTESENGGWPTHVHVQLILDIDEYEDDYPGVCAPSETEYYLKNCPDPSEFTSLS